MSSAAMLWVATVAAYLASAAAFTATPALALHGRSLPLVQQSPKRAGLMKLAMQEEVLSLPPRKKPVCAQKRVPDVGQGRTRRHCVASCSKRCF
jgi:hypothetical protein